MRELLESVFRVGAMPLAVFRQFLNVFSGNSLHNNHPKAAGAAMDRNTDSVLTRPANPPALPSPAHINLQQVSSAPVSSTAPRPISGGNLNTSRFIALGEGLTAGAADFSWSADTQIWSYAVQMARQMNANFPLCLIQPPGFSDFPGFPKLSVRVPAPLQTTVLGHLPPTPVSNLAVPGFRLCDAVSLRPGQPMVDRASTKRTAANLVWGAGAIAQGEMFALTQLEYALQQSPTFSVVQFGYYEALEGAIHEDLDLLPGPEILTAHYSEIFDSLKNAGSEVLVLNVPNPIHTAHFSRIEMAAAILRVEPSFLIERYELAADDVITLNGLNEISFQIFGKSLAALPPGSFIKMSTAIRIRDRIASINQALHRLAEKHQVTVYDLAGLFQRVANQGYYAGSRMLTGEYLGGFYSLNGYYPGQTGQAIIANEILELLKNKYNANFPAIDLNAVISTDPAAACTRANGPLWSSESLSQLPFNSHPQLQCEHDTALDRENTKHFSVSQNWEQVAPIFPEPLKKPLQLPPTLEQVLPLNTASSYFGDGISGLNIRNPQEARFGGTPSFIFGGLAMVDSHISGSLRIRFTQPVNNVSHFELSFMGGFNGADSILAAPQFFKMAFQQSRVDEYPGLVSSGDVDLTTGEVTNLTVYAQFSGTALLALVGSNPNFPKDVLTFKNPPPSNCPPPTPEQQQIYASAWAQFEQRPDGNLDFTFYGSMFIPLGPDIVWPLNFCGTDGKHATVPANGTVLHPHLQISTRAAQFATDDMLPDIPFNTIQEFTLFSHSSAFGDTFHLNAKHLGGPATGRSHLMGRIQVQFGSKSQNSVPVAVQVMRPGGIMAVMPPSPITESFPSPLSPGAQGFNEFLRFPMRNYPLDSVALINDPFDISIGAIDLHSGRLLNQLLHRSFISQDLIFALLRVEPCTPRNTFFFRGPALFARGPRNQRVFRFQGGLRIPYPAGFNFPNPDFATGFIVGPDSRLDPFLWIHAIQNGTSRGIVKEGKASNLQSSAGDIFSYRYRVSDEPANLPPFFEYENHSQQGSFRLHSLAWIEFNSSASCGSDYDTVTFSGFGFWSKDGVKSLQQVAVHICNAKEKFFAGIQVASGDISNVNTKPPLLEMALP